MKLNKISIFTIIIFLIILSLVYISTRVIINNQTKKELKIMMDNMQDLSKKQYNSNQIKDLPGPVQKYFKYALKEGQPYISSVHLEHDGQFKTDLDKDWIDIKGEQYFTSFTPSFLWKGKTSLFSVKDMFISGKGKINVKLLNLFTVVKGEGPKYDQGELLRWLGESVWFPTNLLPSDNLKWSKIDETSANLTFYYNNQELNYKVSFNEVGEITQLETERYMGEENKETWIGRLSDYKEINRMKIPMKIEAIWKLADKEHSYAKFNVLNIQHN